jgi:hypothetical protein
MIIVSNNPILPIVPNGSGLVGDANNDDGSEDLLPVNDPDLDEGETNDDQNQVDQDVREAGNVNDKLDK